MWRTPTPLIEEGNLLEVGCRRHTAAYPAEVSALPRYYRAKGHHVNATTPFLLSTRATKLTILVNAILKMCTPSASPGRLAATLYLRRPGRPRSQARPTPPPIEALALHPQRAGECSSGATSPGGAHPRPPRLPRLLGLAIDRTPLNTTSPSDQRIRYQVLGIATPRKGRVAAFAPGL